MIIDNLTNPGADPQKGDLLRYTYPNGRIVEKTFLPIAPEEHATPEKQVTRSEFFGLFTDAELQDILAAKKSSAKAELWMFKLECMDRFKMSNKLITGGLNYLENQGIITAERKAQIVALQPPA